MFQKSFLGAILAVLALGLPSVRSDGNKITCKNAFAEAADEVNKACVDSTGTYWTCPPGRCFSDSGGPYSDFKLTSCRKINEAGSSALPIHPTKFSISNDPTFVGELLAIATTDDSQIQYECNQQGNMPYCDTCRQGRNQ